MFISKIARLSKIVLLIVGTLFFCSLLFPIWQIDLEAPQYPEGLVLKLYAHKIGGDVEIINGLNHYIGMKTLHTENFTEFKVLPYIIGIFGIVSLLTIFFSNKKNISILFISFIVFSILAGIDFYRWNYNYGHNLDPNAAIQIPGMAYQPPLIGYKQLLNFGAYSIPDVGGWMLIIAGVLLSFVVIKETKRIPGFKKTVKNQIVFIATILLLVFTLLSCNTNKPKPIKLNTDSCAFCKMTISNGKFGAEVFTQKGRCYKFDDVACMVKYVKNYSGITYTSFFINDYLKYNTLIPVEESFFLKGGKISSPMGGNIAAFRSETDVEKYKQKLDAEHTTWQQIFNTH